jgi:hypothetical protein
MGIQNSINELINELSEIKKAYLQKVELDKRIADGSVKVIIKPESLRFETSPGLANSYWYKVLEQDCENMINYPFKHFFVEIFHYTNPKRLHYHLKAVDKVQELKRG